MLKKKILFVTFSTNFSVTPHCNKSERNLNNHFTFSLCILVLVKSGIQLRFSSGPKKCFASAIICIYNASIAGEEGEAGGCWERGEGALQQQPGAQGQQGRPQTDGHSNGGRRG